MEPYISDRVVRMEKIVIIGSPGAGKSTFARKLGSILTIKVVHLDRVFWRYDWQEKPRETRIDILQKLVQEKQWLIEGTYLGSSEPRLNKADTIIFLDIPFLLCLERIIKRHRKPDGHPRHDIPDGCIDNLNLFRMLKVLVFPLKGRRTLQKKLREFPKEKVITLQSTKEADDFLAQLKPRASENSKPHYRLSRV